MKFPVVFALLAAATVVMAETNAERFARGLAPNAPVRRDPTRVAAARRHHPSGSPKCSHGHLKCCTSYGMGGEEHIKKLLERVGAPPVDDSTRCGESCSNTDGKDCDGELACCDHDDFNGLIVTGCTPINISI